MPRISLTNLVDVISASGTPKATKVRQIKNREPYHPSRDYYKYIRDNIEGCHQNGNSKAELKKLLKNLPDPRKADNFAAVVNGYSKWWGTKALKWFAPTDGLYIAHGIEVSVNPELGFEINGTPHLVKLYLKQNELTKNRIDIITHLMAVTLGPRNPKTAAMGVLDTRRGRLLVPTVPIPGLDAVLDAELAYIAALWPKV